MGSVESRFMNLCDNLTALLKNSEKNDYVEYFEKEKEAVRSGEYKPEWEDLLCLSVLYKQIQKENDKKANKVKG
jgi:hypothetical protein